MHTIPSSEFKANCLAIMNDVARSGETLVITKNGRPLVELRPYFGAKTNSPFGMHPTLVIKGNIFAPTDEDAWESLA